MVDTKWSGSWDGKLWSYFVLQRQKKNRRDTVSVWLQFREKKRQLIIRSRTIVFRTSRRGKRYGCTNKSFIMLRRKRESSIDDHKNLSPTENTNGFRSAPSRNNSWVYHNFSKVYFFVLYVKLSLNMMHECNDDVQGQEFSSSSSRLHKKESSWSIFLSRFGRKLDD